MNHLFVCAGILAILVPWAGSLLIRVGTSKTNQELIVGEKLAFVFDYNSSWADANGCVASHEDLGFLDFPPLPLTPPGKRPEGWVYKRYGDEVKECGIEVPVTDQRDNGNWTIQSYSYIVLVKVPPSEIVGSGSGTDLEVNKASKFKCSAKNSRPAATVTWTIDGRQSSELNETTSVTTTTSEKLINVDDELTLYPRANYDGKILKCSYSHPAIMDSRNNSHEFVLTVVGPPDPIHNVTFPAGLILGQPVEVKIQVHSNPMANTFTYYMKDLTKPVVIEYNPSRVNQKVAVQEGRYSFESITQEERLFTSIIKFDELLSTDVNAEFTMVVTNMKGNTNYTIKFENPSPIGLSSGAVAGIVIGVIVLVALVGFLVYYLIKVKKVGSKKKSKKLKTTTAVSNPVVDHS